jgi:hypothetical protein
MRKENFRIARSDGLNGLSRIGLPADYADTPEKNQRDAHCA